MDENKIGKDSDHNIVVFAPRSDANFQVQREKKIIQTRPIPESRLPGFVREVQSQNWDNIIQEEDINIKVF